MRRADDAMSRSILYLHGFRSSPTSFKARLMADAMAERGLAGAWACPQLPASPRQAIDLAMDIARRQLEGAPDPRALTVIGSSLGGFYATWLAEQLGCQAVLLNPAVQARATWPPRSANTACIIRTNPSFSCRNTWTS